MGEKAKPKALQTETLCLELATSLSSTAVEWQDHRVRLVRQPPKARAMVVLLPVTPDVCWRLPERSASYAPHIMVCMDAWSKINTIL